jgi:LysM repeat protein
VSSKAPAATDVYRIRKGDTLSSVAARHSTTVAAIKALNGLSSTRLSIGQILRISAAASDSAFE